MRKFTKSAIVAPLAALVLGLGVVAAASPAAAMGHVAIRPPVGGFSHGPVFPHGGGGRGFYGHHGRGVGLGVLGGLAAGAIIGSAGYPYYDDGGGCYQYRPVYDQWGNYLGQHLVDICQ
ncbi:MAG: hypothetical protein ABSC22_02325 [Roseiarcus sp.]|jgi:hypothetical protein